jgi:hypothetical protein
VGLLSRGNYRARAFKIMRRVNTKRHIINQRRINPHSGFKRAQLLKALADLKR